MSPEGRAFEADLTVAATAKEALFSCAHTIEDLTPCNAALTTILDHIAQTLRTLTQDL